MLIREIVSAHADQLTGTDRRLVAVLQAQPAEAAFWRAQELTEPLGLHQSAATRLAQRLGFDGYPQLRDALRQDYLAGDGPSQRMRGRLGRSADGEVLQGLVDSEIEALHRLPRHVSQTELDELAARVLAARGVYLYGQGNATILVDQLGRRLDRFGVRFTALVGSRRDIAEKVAAMGSEDILLAFAFRRMPTTLSPLLVLAESQGVHSTVVTDTLLAMTPRPSSLVAAPRGDADEFTSLTVPMAISNALVLTIARHSPDRTLRSLDRLGVLLEHLDA